MPWTTEEKLAYLMRLPWTIETAPEDDYTVLRVKELPSVIATGKTGEELEADFWESLRATLEAYTHYDDPIPLPTEVTRLPWQRRSAAAVRADVRVAVLEGEHRPPQLTALAPTETVSPFQTRTVPVPA